MKKIVMVTGGTGYIGNWVVKYLLEKSYVVRLTVRNKNKQEKYTHLQQLADASPGELEIWEADLLEDGSYDASAKGAEIIFHLASPFTLRFDDAQKDLIEPALNGTRNVLSAATKSGTVKKVVLTSSVAAVHGDNIDMKELELDEFTEEHFNYSSTIDHQPYSYSKTVAEKEAWKIYEQQDQWKLVVINPSFVVGPSLTTTSDSESLQLLKDLLNGKYKLGAPKLQFGFVDVRDVARAHVIAAELENAKGRHILAERVMGIMDVANILKKEYGSKYPLPAMRSPKFMMFLVGWMFGLDFKFIKRNIGYEIELNNEKSKEKLQLKYTPIERTLVDMVEQMENQKMIEQR